MDERAAQFMARYPAKKLSRQRLSQIYKKNKVRKKKIRVTKIMDEIQRRKVRF